MKKCLCVPVLQTCKNACLSSSWRAWCVGISSQSVSSEVVTCEPSDSTMGRVLNWHAADPFDPLSTTGCGLETKMKKKGLGTCGRPRFYSWHTVLSTAGCGLEDRATKPKPKNSCAPPGFRAVNHASFSRTLPADQWCCVVLRCGGTLQRTSQEP